MSLSWRQRRDCATGTATYGEGTLEGDLVLLDVLDCGIRDSSLAVLDDGGDIDGLPSNGDL